MVHEMVVQDPEVAALSSQIRSLTRQTRALLDDIDATVVMLEIYRGTVKTVRKSERKQGS